MSSMPRPAGRRPSFKSLNPGRLHRVQLDREELARNVPSRWASTNSRFAGRRLQLVGIARTCSRRLRKRESGCSTGASPASNRSSDWRYFDSVCQCVANERRE